MIVKKEFKEGITVDLTGPSGNAYNLLGLAKSLSKPDHADILAEMMSGDYENLVSVFDEYFGDVVTLER